MIYILLADGFEETEALVPADLLRRAGQSVQLVGLENRQVLGAHGISINADLLLDQIDLDGMEMLILPGGGGGVENIRTNLFATALIQKAHERGCYLGAICAAPTILAGLAILDRRHATCYPEVEDDMGSAVIVDQMPVVKDGRIITAKSAAFVFEFAFALIEVLEDNAMVERVKDALVYCR